MTDRVREEGEKNHCYKIVKWGETGKLYILNGIRDHLALVQLVDTAINVNHDVSIIGCWIYDSNHKRALPLIK